jgi:hypothetical protein
MDVRVCTVGRRRCIWLLPTAATTWCGCSSPTARTPPRETTNGSFGGGERTPSTQAADVPLVLPSGHCQRRVRALGPAYNRGCYLGYTLGAVIVQQCGSHCCLVAGVLAMYRPRTRSTAQPLQASSAMPVATPSILGCRLLRRSMPRDKAKDKGAFDAAVTVRRPLPIGARASLGDRPSIAGRWRCRPRGPTSPCRRRRSRRRRRRLSTARRARRQDAQRCGAAAAAVPTCALLAGRAARRCGGRCCLRLHESGPCGGSAIAVCGSPPAPASGESASPVGAAAGLVEGSKLHDAARIGDLAAVEARPPASLALSRSHARRLQRLLAEPAGRAAVNATDVDGYAAVRFPPSAPCRNSTHSRMRACRCPRKFHVPGSKEYIFARTSIATAGHERTHNHICIIRVYFVRVCPPAHSTRVLPHTHAHTCVTKQPQVRSHTHTHKETATQRTPTPTRGFTCPHTHLARRRVWACAFHRRWTPLHKAAGKGHTAVVAALLTNGADANAKTNFGCGGWSLFLGNGRRAAVADRDRIDAMQMWMHTHTRDARTPTAHE